MVGRNPKQPFGVILRLCDNDLLLFRFMEEGKAAWCWSIAALKMDLGKCASTWTTTLYNPNLKTAIRATRHEWHLIKQLKLSG
jgi:hypothetical protein